MHIAAILRIIGLFLLLFSFSHLPPLLVNYYYQDGEAWHFIISFAATFAVGAGLFLLFRKQKMELTRRDGFLIVVLFWFVLSGFATIPFILNDHPDFSFTDSMFESVSGFTTTGASVFKVSDLPMGIRYYRQQLHFFGGMGIIVLAIAILPILGVGGMQLYQAETPGPLKESKMTPRITETAKLLWYIYVGLTATCALAYWLGGMPFIEAIGESFSTISTGGFSMQDKEFAHYNSALLEIFAIFFMFLGGVNFSLHFLALQKRSLKNYWRDEEFRAYFLILLLVSLAVALILFWHNIYQDTATTLRMAAFNTVSLITTTGFQAGSTQNWPMSTALLITIFTLIGGCAASTSGGIKVIRWLLILKEVRRESHRLLHPQAILTIKFDKHLLPERIVQAMWAFIGAFIGLYLALILLVTLNGVSLEIAVGAVTSALTNTGAAIGPLTTDFAGLSDSNKWLLIFAMLAGRLEIFTLLMLLSPDFWRR